MIMVKLECGVYIGTSEWNNRLGNNEGTEKVVGECDHRLAASFSELLLYLDSFAGLATVRLR